MLSPLQDLTFNRVGIVKAFYQLGTELDFTNAVSYGAPQQFFRYAGTAVQD